MNIWTVAAQNWLWWGGGGRLKCSCLPPQGHFSVSLCVKSRLHVFALLANMFPAGSGRFKHMTFIFSEPKAAGPSEAKLQRSDTIRNMSQQRLAPHYHNAAIMPWWAALKMQLSMWSTTSYVSMQGLLMVSYNATNSVIALVYYGNIMCINYTI